MDVDFMISDTFEMLRPQLHIIPTYEQANEAVDRILLEQLKNVQGTDKVPEDRMEESGEGSDSSSAEEEYDMDEFEQFPEEIQLLDDDKV